MKNNLRWIGRWLVLIFVLGLSLSAEGVPINFEVDLPDGYITDGMLRAIDARTGRVQLINAGRDKAVNPPKAWDAASGGVTGDDAVITDTTGERFDQLVGYNSANPAVYLSGGAVFFQGEIEVNDGDVLYLRAWTAGNTNYGNSVSTLGTPFNYAITLGMRATYGDEWKPVIIADRLAAAPPTPLVPSTEVLYDAGLSPRLNVTFRPDEGIYDINETTLGNLAYSYVFYSNDAGTGSGSDRWTSDSNYPSITILSGTSGIPDWFFARGTHSVRTKARNWFGQSAAESPPAQYNVISARGGQAVYNVRISRVDDSNLQIRWKATSGGPAFDLYRTTNVSGATVDWGTAIDVTATAAGDDWFVNRALDPALDPALPAAAEEYWRVVPDGATLSEYPRDIVGRKTYVFKTSLSGLGVNSFSLPFTRNWALGTGAPVSTAAELETALPGFQFVGGWNATGQTEFSYLAGRARGTSSFDLLPGVGYQLSLGGTTPTYAWTLIGIK